MLATPPAPWSDAWCSAWCDALPGMALLLDASGAAHHANPALAEFAGQPGTAMLGHGWQAIVGPPSRGALLTALQEGADFAMPVELRGPEARSGWYDGAGRWLPGQARCLLLLRDVGASALAEATAQAGLFRLLANNVPVLIAYYRALDYRCQFANRQYAETFGFDEHTIVGRTVAEVIGDPAARLIQPEIEAVQGHGKPVTYERVLSMPDGGSRWIEVHLVPHIDEQHETVGAFVLISDITKHRLAERAVRESEERLAKFMQASAEGIVFHRDGIITDANPPLCRLLDYALDELLGQRALDFIAPDEVPKVAAVMTSGQELTYETAVLDRHGERVPVEFIVRTMLRNGERMRMTIVRDIRDRHAAQARIHHLAHHDALTGLPNRASFMDRLADAMTAARTSGTPLAVLFIDLDHFKRVNDSLGHLVGDALLRTVTERIRASLRSTDLVARFGGDEFMALLPRLAAPPRHRADAEEVARKLLVAIEAPVQAEGRPISVTPSVGIALYPGDGQSADDLIQHADSAMYQAKARGRANYQFFDPYRVDTAYAALVIEGELAQALERGEFELHFQPLARAADGAITGAEALIRWNHPQRGLLLPDAFIPVAEQQRLMLPIGQWVLREAAACAMRWHAQGLGIATVAVNLSSVQFQSIGFVDAVAQVLPRDGIGEGLIELELTERMLMDDLPEVKWRLDRLKALGLRISIDDFGTGYSSLAHLKELPIDKLKIDRSFVKDLPHDHDSCAITRAVIQLGKSLGLAVLAEGVETDTQRAYLAAQGCDEVQGLLISGPLSGAGFEAFLARRHPTRATAA
ncbi:MAG: EAL domain-containing protein [Proteobacteria bacterium]|nr:EAL domain-containing protein [Pseudomonadota bacterium]